MSLLTDQWLRFWRERLEGLDCQGLDDRSIAQIATAQGADCLPESFDAFLRIAGASCGRLWHGSDSYFPRLLTLKDSALSLTEELGADLPSLNNGAVVFLMHQGYVFLYVSSVGEDPAVMQFHESFKKPEQIATSFSEFVVSSIAEMRRH